MARSDRVANWMTANPQKVRVTDSLRDAYDLMTEHGIRRLCVIDDDEALVGMITESDIRRIRPGESETARGNADLPLEDRVVSEVMAWEPVTVNADDTVQTAAETMIEAGVSGLPVLEGDKLVGIITESDVFRLVVEGWGKLR